MSEDGTVHLSDDIEQLIVPRALFMSASFFLSIYFYCCCSTHSLLVHSGFLAHSYFSFKGLLWKLNKISLSIQYLDMRSPSILLNRQNKVIFYLGFDGLIGSE